VVRALDTISDSSACTDLCAPATHARVSRHYAGVPDEGEYGTDLVAIPTDRLARDTYIRARI
jgi:hypothetical protein